MSRLWDKGEPLDSVIERFTVGRDPELDLVLAPYDALGSAAHARMLAAVGLLEPAEAEGIVAELAAIAAEAREGRFTIARADEDCHTAIENRLTERLGEAGQKIHTGRSRNDQVIAAIRLWAREVVLALALEVIDVASALAELAEAHREVPVPGYTHTRQAMPSTLGCLFEAHAELLADDLPWIETAIRHLDRSPLGAASGFGVPLPLDRQLVADLLELESVQSNVIAVQCDRGKTEHLVATACFAPVLDLARLATDLIWFSGDELGFVKLAAAVTTGSSIMPQKRNPDALELVRATAARLRGRAAEIASVFGPLSSGYHRDLQLTKEPFVEGLLSARDVLRVMKTVLTTLEVDAERCRAAFHPAIGATDAMCQRIAEGRPMRLAYREVAADPEGALGSDPAEAWRARTHLGAPGALDVAPLRRQLEAWARALERRAERWARAWDRLLGL